MKILFIQNFGINESLAITDISAFLKSKGHVCDLLIESKEKKIVEAVKNILPDIFIIPWDIGTCSWTLNVVGTIKKYFDAPIVVCGTYPSFYPDNVIKYSNVDILCIGESEYALLELIDRIEKQRDIKDIRNLWIKNDGLIYKNELRPLVNDLDSLPIPDRDIYFEKYKYLKDMSLKRFTSGRGCPNSCRFCYNPLFRQRYSGKGNYVRRKSVLRIIQEIETVRNTAALKSVHFSDDIFITDKKWLREFCEEYKKKISIPFTCNAAAETIDEEVRKIIAGITSWTDIIFQIFKLNMN